MLDGSAHTLVLTTLLAVLERETTDRGQPSLMDRLLRPLEGQGGGNVLDFAFAKETEAGAKWRREAIELVHFAKSAAMQLASPP